MHRLRITSAVLSLILYVAHGAHAEEPGLKLRMQPELIPYVLGRDEPTDLFVDADHVEGHQEQELEAAGSVRLRKRGTAIFSDQLHLSFPDQQFTATGHVRFEKEGDVITGDQLFYDLDNDSGYIDKPAYRLLRYGARGDAGRLVAENRDLYKIDKATYTNCDVGDDDWFMRIDRLELDRLRDIGVAHNATVVFKGVPILYSPYLDFSLSGRRKTGLLPPTIGSTGQSGFEYTQPFYWNIAPNRDATIAPRLLAKRGVLMNGDFRYLEPDLKGEMRGEYLPDDRQKDQTRYAYSWQHQQNFGNGFSGALDLQGVSDDTYFTDLSDKIAATSQTNLNRQGNLFYDGDWWNLNTRVQRFQTLQDPLAPVVPPYARMPQITLNMNRPTDVHLDFGLQGEYVEFVHPTLLNGRREILYPSISAPFQTSFFYLTPKVGYHTTNYSFEDPNRAGESRNLPIYSVDSALTFERETALWGRAFLQTLEPRLYYVYIPFRPQDQLPNFDTALADFNLAQIFTENRFSGGDRINDANQLTAAVTSRLIDPDNGDEQLRFTLGQRYYFKQQQVSLTPALPGSDRSDVLAAATGQITKHWFTDLGMQYSVNDNRTERSNAVLRYQPDVGKVVNFGYRFTRDTLEQVDLSTEWPIGGRWTGLARYNYTLRDRRLLEGLLGVEYNAGCWAARFVLHRFVSATQEYVNAMFFQLELNGVSRIGSSPLELLRQNITGYTKTNEKRPADFNPFPSF
ncbi:MAG: LPS-assembly protein LptD [Betaproteobacteria bacterium]|nr:LPS-assembly protein LptD [Betaproteobacteria bacterium]